MCSWHRDLFDNQKYTFDTLLLLLAPENLDRSLRSIRNRRRQAANTPGRDISSTDSHSGRKVLLLFQSIFCLLLDYFYSAIFRF